MKYNVIERFTDNDEFSHYDLIDTETGETLIEGIQETLESEGLKLVAKERLRQKEVEGWTPENDEKYLNNELADAAICYLVDPQHRDYSPFPWPWDDAWWKPSENRVRELEKAGGLIVAEIDRLILHNKKNNEV